MLSEFALKQNSNRHNDSCCPESVDETEAIIHLADSKIWKQLNEICYKKHNRYKRKTVPMLLFQKNVDYRSQKVKHRQKTSHKQHRHKLEYYQPEIGAYLVLNNSVDLIEKDMDDLVTNLKLLSLNDDVCGTFSEETEFKIMEPYYMPLNCNKNAVVDDRCLREISVKTDCVPDKPLTDQEALAVNSEDAVALPDDDDITGKNITQNVLIYDVIADNLMSHNTYSGQISYDLAGNIKDDDKTVEGGSRFTYEYSNVDSHNDMSHIKWNCIKDNYVKDAEKNMLKANSEWNCITVKETENSMLKSNSDKCNVVPVKSQLKHLSSPCRSSFFISPVEIDSSEESDNDSHCQDEDGWTSNDEVTSDILHEDIFSSFKGNGLYFPNKHLLGSSDRDLKDYGKSIMIYPLSSDYETDSVCLSPSRSENSDNYDNNDDDDDDVVFSSDCDTCPKEKEDEETTQIYKMSRIEISNHKWNQAYPYTAKTAGQNDMKCKKTVHFAFGSHLVTIRSELASEAKAYAAARKGPWEEYARDRDRFTRRIRDTEEQISWVLSQSHRERIYSILFSNIIS